MNNLIENGFVPMLVSVIIPTYNREFFIEETINSVLNQSYPYIECIIIDDGSTDKTNTLIKAIIESYKGTKKISYNFQNNAGAQVARNKGISISKGQFLQFLDSDDVLKLNKIEKQVQYLIQHPKINVVYGNTLLGFSINNITRINAIKNDEHFIKALLRREWNAPFSYLIKRGKRLPCWDISLRINQDFDFFLSLALNGYIFGYQNIETGCYRQHEMGKVSEKMEKYRIDDTTLILDKTINHLKQKNILNKNYLKIIAEYFYFLGFTFCFDDFKTYDKLTYKANALYPGFKFNGKTTHHKFIRFFGKKFGHRLWVYGKKIQKIFDF